MAPIPHTSRGADLTTGTHDGARLNAEFDRLYADANNLLTQIENALGLAGKVDSEVLAARKGQPNLLAEIDRLEAIKAEVEAARSSAAQGGFGSLDARLEAIDSRITAALSAVQGSAEVVEARTDDAGKVHAAIRDAINKGSKDLEGLSLAAINRIVISAPLISAAVIYDTSRDSDGGAWRERCQHLSWFGETLNTSTRGKTAKFPAIALIVAASGLILIFDATDPDLPMWMIFEQVDQGALDFDQSGIGYSGAISSLAAINGILYIGKNTGGNQQGLRVINFLTDTVDRISDVDRGGTWRFKGNIAQRNDSLGGRAYASTAIVNLAVNDVAATILPGAPIDPSTGIPVPTIALASAGGISVINNNGTVANITGFTSPPLIVGFTSDKKIFSTGQYLDQFRVYPIPSADTTIANSEYSYVSGAMVAPFQVGGTTIARAVGIAAGSIAIGSGNSVYGGLSYLYRNPVEPTKGMVSYTTKDYFSGILPGDIRRAWLANSPTTDRSVKNKPLTQVGAITASPVAPGADLMAYSGFNTSNYLKEPYSAELDFGTGDFCVLGWLKENPNSAGEAIFTRGYHVGSVFVGPQIMLYLLADGRLRGEITDDAGATYDRITSSIALDDSTWKFVKLVRRGNALELWVNGVKAAVDVTIVNAAASLSNPLGVTRLGLSLAGALPLTNGSLALWRVAAYAPTPEQIRMIYEYEKHLFTEGAKCLLGGTSNAVQALDYDPETGILLVGTGNGVSLFQGLRRTNHIAAAPLTNTNMKAVSGRNGAILMASEAEAVYQAPQRNIREEVERVKRRFVAQTPRTAWFTSTASQVDFDLPTRAARILGVTVAGALAREASGAATNRYQVLDYGYKQTIRLGASPTTGSDVAVQYIEEV